MTNKSKFEEEYFKDSVLRPKDFDKYLDNYQSFPIKSISTSSSSNINLIETNINRTVAVYLTNLISELLLKKLKMEIIIIMMIIMIIEDYWKN